MTESLCSCCKLLGAPPARVNFIIITGLPDSLVYQRINYLLKNYSETSSSANDARLTNYESLMDISDQLFRHQSDLSPVNQSTAASTSTSTCCHGFSTLAIDIDDISNSFQVDTFRKDILDLLDSKVQSTTEKKDTKAESESWIMLSGSICLESVLLNVFLQLKDQNLPLFDFTFTVLCLLVDEQRLFENWLFHNLSIQDYQLNTYPKYERRIKDFFSLLNTSKYLQQNTLLVEEQSVLTDDKLQILLQNLFQKGPSKYRSTNEKVRRDMAKLLSSHHRTVRDVRNVRNNLQRCYHQTTEDRLKPLFSALQQPATAANAARQVVHLVLNEFERMNEEELRVYKRQLILGFKSNDAKHSNTIASQLVHYALHLLQNDSDTSVPLIYSIILVICALGCHFFFRHELFNHTPEIYTLSMLLVNQRQYALTLSGLRLCTTILNGDQNEHKYAIAYLTHDPLVARKILDAIKWLLSPFQTLKILWKKEEEKEETDLESDVEDNPSYIAEKCCFRHSDVLLRRSYIRNLASLFYGSVGHCAQVTVDDVHKFAQVIDVLADPRMAGRTRGENKSRLSLMLISDLCALLTPILLYSSPSVSAALVNEDHLLLAVPRAIRGLIKTDDINTDITNICVRFYTQFIQSKCKQDELSDDTEDEDEIKPPNMTTTETIINSPISLDLTEDLIKSYFNLYQQIQNTALLDDKSTQQEQVQTLFNAEWKKLDILQLQHDHEQLKQEHMTVKNELSQLRNELQRTQLERDQSRKENIRMAQEIDRLKLLPTTAGVTVESQQMSIHVSTDNNNQENIIDKLQDLLPHDISTEQAEQCIREIYHRRTTFNDHDMRKSICGSLKHLGSDLYSSPVHFLHELIQNAEDNAYDPAIIPCLRIELNHNYILLSNNEQGLRTQDVLAICSLAVSTKTIQQQHIGEKGVGFKSVFAASNQPMLISHAWKFSFHVSDLDAMSYITPLWIIDQDIPDCISNQISTNAQNTHLYLPLKLHAHTLEAGQFLNQVTRAADPCILLNMRQLKKLEIIDKRQDKVTIIEKQLIGATKLEQQSNVTFEEFTFVNLTGSIIQLCTSTGYNTFRVYTCQINVPNSIEQRRSSTTRLILALPCENDYYLTCTVYAGLPVCDLGFNFLFNADFQLVTNRENVRENVPFNAFIRDHLATLFVYLLLNDIDLRKDINRYCPSSNSHQVKHSSWWLVMIDRINELITKYLPVLFDIRTGKSIRHFNQDYVSLISNEQLYNCADIQVIDSADGFFTVEQLKSFQVQSVSIVDVLHCFPSREETANESRQQFRLWAQKQDEHWWAQFFHHISQTMTSQISDIMVQKPIFLLSNNQQRQYLPTNADTHLLLFISDDESFEMWKRQLTLLRYSSKSERSALLKSNQVQLLTDARMIEIILHDHIQLAISTVNTCVDGKLVEEVWQDLFYLQSRLHQLDKSARFLVPAKGIPNLVAIETVLLPSILGVDIRSFTYSTTSPVILLPYHGAQYNQLIDNLRWEYFLLEMNCQRPSIYLPPNYTITQLPLLPSFTMFADEQCARLGELIVSSQTENTRDCLRQFPIVDNSNIEQQISPVSATFDKAIVHDLPSLPRLTLSPQCRSLAIKLGVCVEYDLRTCVTILQLLSDEKNTNIDLYIQWLGHLQLYVRQQHAELNKDNLLSSCQLYFPEQQQFCSLKDLLVVASDNAEHRDGILLVSKYLKLQLISPSINQIYWQFKDLFRLLGCRCAVSIGNIYTTIYLASYDKTNFFALGDCTTTLTENGVETMITLFQYLENLIMKCVEENVTEVELYRAVVENKHPTAPCGSREDLEWRFGFTCNSLSRQLKKLTGIQSQHKKIGLLTIDRQIVAKRTDNIVYACLETKIIHNLSKDIGKRYFISPSITRSCPLVLATFEIDYIERRGRIEWIHKNHNLEYHLTQLTDIFCNALNDPKLQVIASKYAIVTLLLSDSFVIDSTNGQDEDEINRHMVDSDYPFWLFNKIILLCTGNEKEDAPKAIIATSALATLLHKRKHIPFDEAKSIAQQKISACTAFRSNELSPIASTGSTVYSYTDLLFPTDHHAIESMAISIGGYCVTEQDPEEDTTTIIAADQMGEDRVYRNRVQTQDHTLHNTITTNRWTDPTIVDSVEQIRIGQNAEYFFFVYLQKLYGSVDVTPTQNWRSSSRLKFYPLYRRNVDDAAGYDFELHDTREVFVRGSGSTTKRCYFEVKGTSGSFNAAHTRFHISQNEFEMCETIVNQGGRREREAYFIVIIQNCLDPEKISFGITINWSGNFNKINGVVDSYKCRIAVPSAANFSNSREEEEEARYYNNGQQQQQSIRSNDRNNNSVPRSTRTNSGYSVSSQHNPSSYQNQQQQQQQSRAFRGRGGGNNAYH